MKKEKGQVTAFEDLNTAKFLAELQAGSIQAFEHLAVEMFDPLCRFLQAQSAVPKSDAEEIVQDTLLRVHAAVGSFRTAGGAKLTTWIFRIARNDAVDFHRASLQVLEELDEDTLPVQSDTQFAGSNFDYLSKLREELEKFSARDQQILMWRARDLSYAEIAGWLGIKDSTARVQHHRAQKRLSLACGESDLHEEINMEQVQESGAAHG